MQLFKGQEFNDYKALCRFLGEEPKGGNSKKAQIKRWKSHFDYQTEGYKIIITDVYDTPQKTESMKQSNNHKNMDIYLPYIHGCLYEGFKERMSMSYITTNTLNILNPDVLWKDDSDDGFDRWVGSIRMFISNNVETALDHLKRTGDIEYKAGYAFVSKPKKTIYTAYTTEFNDYIEFVEKKVCDKLNEKYGISKKLSGRQLKFIIQKNKRYRKKYWTGVTVGILRNKELMEVLQNNIEENYHGIIFGSEEYPIDNYWRIWEITGVTPPKVVGSREKYIELIMKKTAKGRNIPQTWLDKAFNVDIFQA